MGLNTNALHVNIQPLQGCNLLVHFNHRLPPSVITFGELRFAPVNAMHYVFA